MATFPRTAAVMPVGRGCTGIIRTAAPRFATRQSIIAAEQLGNSQLLMSGSQGIPLNNQRRLLTNTTGKIGGNSANGHRGISAGAARVLRELRQHVARQGNPDASKTDIPQEKGKTADAKDMCKKFKDFQKEYPASFRLFESFLVVISIVGLGQFLSRRRSKQIEIDTTERDRTRELLLLKHANKIASANLSRESQAVISRLSQDIPPFKTEPQPVISDSSQEIRSVKMEDLWLDLEQRNSELFKNQGDGKKTLGPADK